MAPDSFSLQPKDITRIASLGRLGLSEEEVQAATKNVTGILEHFSAIQHVDTAQVAPADEVRELHNVTRSDEAMPNELGVADAFIEHAPALEKNQVKVPAVFDSTTL